MKPAVLALACLAALSAAPAGAATLRAPLSRQPATLAQPRTYAYASTRGYYLGRVSTGETISVLVHLRGQRQAELDALVNTLMSPDNILPRYLTPEEFGAYFGADPATYGRAIATLRRAGFTIDWLAANRTDIVAHAPASRAEALFATPLDVRQENGRRYFANRFEPMMPAGIDATAISGLDNYTQFHPIGLHADGTQLGSWTPSDIAAGYALNGLYAKGFDGKGITIDNSTSGAASASDLALYQQDFNFPNEPLISVPVGGGLRASCGASCPGANGESSLDADSATGIAHEVTFKQVVAHSSSNHDFDLSYAYIVNDKGVHVVTTSWGVCEQAFSKSPSWKIDDADLKQAITEGQFWFSASGDNGTDDCQNGTKALSVDYPGSSPYVISVGGTTVEGHLNAAGNVISWKNETAWQWSISRDGASGGGKSVLYKKPSYQAGVTPNDGARDVPDVALIADNGVYAVLNGQLEGGWKGTSDAAPMWAGFFAIIEQMKGGKALAEPHARLYALARSSRYHELFHDVVSGYNGVPSGFDPYGTFAGYHAGPGFDLTTGWGSFIGTPLAEAY